MNDLIQAVHRFDDHRVTTLSYQGRPAWLAREVGAAIGYAQDGKRFATQITREWSAEFVDGKDFAVLTGSEAALLQKAVGEGTEAVPSRSNRGVLVLFESGLYLALAKTEKEAGIRFRRFIVDDVMPQIARTGAYAGKAAPEEQSERQCRFAFIVAVPAPANATMAVVRERRLAAQHDLRARKFESEALRSTVRTLHALDQIDTTTRAAYEVAAAEIALGEELPELRPVVHERWYSPTQIGRMARVTPQAVGLAITRLGLRGAEGFSRSVMTKAKYHDRLVYSWVYNEPAVERILAELLGEPPRSA